MKYLFIVLFQFFTVIYSFGQIVFEKGYYIDNQNRKTECLIKNMDWRNNPAEFTFKQDVNDMPVKLGIDSVKEFCIYGISKYIRVNILVDRSSNNIDGLSDKRNPVWNREQLFLKVILEGKASLYFLEDGNLNRLFYSVSDTSVNQLIYKRFFVGRSVAENNGFRQQLWVDVKCPGADLRSVEKLQYTLSDIKRYFINYNKCIGDSIIVYGEKIQKDFFNLKIAPGINNSSISLHNGVTSFYDYDFKKTLTFRMGIEAEFILPFNKNKWGIVMEPTYQYFHVIRTEPKKNTEIRYSSVDIPVGLRYYGYLNQDFRLFVNAFFIPNFSRRFSSEITLEGKKYLDISSGSSYAAGAGIGYKKFSFEMRYYTKKKFSNYSSYLWADYNRLAFILGYRILKVKRNTHR